MPQASDAKYEPMTSQDKMPFHMLMLGRPSQETGERDSLTINMILTLYSDTMVHFWLLRRQYKSRKNKG